MNNSKTYIKPIPPYNAICNILMDLGLPKDIANIIYTYANDVHWQAQQMINKQIHQSRLNPFYDSSKTADHILYFYNNNDYEIKKEHPYKYNPNYRCWYMIISYRHRQYNDIK